MHSPVKSRRRTLGVLAASLTLPLAGVVFVPTAAMAGQSRVSAATSTPAPYSALSTGTVVYANALNLGSTADVLKAELAQSAAAVNSAGSPDSTDQLGQPLVAKSLTGKTSYGHGAPANVGLLAGAGAQPQLALGAADATAPAPSTATGQSISLPLSPLLSADLIPGTAAANTKADNSCVTGNTPISTGTGHAANAQVLPVTIPIAGINTGISVLNVGGTVDSTSTTSLIAPQSADANAGLQSQTIQTVAPITLLAGTPAALTINVLADVELQAAAGGTPGSASTAYGFVDKTTHQPVSDNTPVISITAAGSTTELTTQQLLGNGGLKIALGLADVTIGAPAHSLTGNETTSPSAAADGTSASAAADLIRITVPGTLPIPTTGVGGPLGGILDPILNAVTGGLGALTGLLGDALKNAGLGVADVRVGHLEASVKVPSGGIDCNTPEEPNPLRESVKDVSTTTVPAGQTFTYDIRVPNRGTEPITDVTVKDTYAAGLEFVSSVPAPASQNGNVLTYNLGTLQPNSFTTIVFTFKVPATAAIGTKYSNHADISGTYQGQPITVPVDVDGPTVGPATTGDCTLAQSTKYASNTKVTTGENFGYFVNVSNTGGTPCDDVTVTDNLGAGVQYVSCTANCTVSGNTVTWKLGTLAPGQSTVVSVVVKVVATSGTLPNTAHITTPSGPGGDPSTTGPTVTDTSVPAEGVPAGPGNGAGGGGNGGSNAGGPLAYTGLDSGLPLVALGLVIGGLGVMALRRRRSA